jgi:hypothetical protein
MNWELIRCELDWELQIVNKELIIHVDEHPYE